MMSISPYLLGLCALGVVFTATSHLEAQTSPAVSLFDGQSLHGWDGSQSSWRVENGVIIGEVKEGENLLQNEFLYWRDEVHDFDLELEFQISSGPQANSGVQFRSERTKQGAVGYQADIDDGTAWLGRIYDEHGRDLLAERGAKVSIAPDGRRAVEKFADAQAMGTHFKPQTWNTYRIRATASRIELWLNGTLFSTVDDHYHGAADLGGKLALQLHSGKGPVKVQFRNIRLTTLGSSPAPAAPVLGSPYKADVKFIQPLDEAGAALNLGFEKGTLDGWTADGKAWEGQPVKGDSVKSTHRGYSNHAGEFWIGGWEKGQSKATGTLSSAPFKVTQPWASYLIGGGQDEAATRVEIVEADSGKVIHKAAGRNTNTMSRQSVDLRAWQGKRIFVRLVDNSTDRVGNAFVEKWGHLNFDDFVFHDREPALAEPQDKLSRRLTESPVLWHLQKNPAVPTPVPNASAQATVAGMKLTTGFAADLVAAEPDIRQPIAFAFDDRGRIWAVEAYSYPNRQPEGKGKDRIVILEDADGDGLFETRKVFQEGLNLVSGIELGFGGVWVGAAPELLFIPDKNRDDKPDGPPQVLLDGWGYQDTHETLNSFTWGPDGWLYGHQGVFVFSRIGKPGTPQEKRATMRAGVWRFHPVRHEFEIYSTGGSNQWGLDYDESGAFFMTHCRSFWGGGGTTYVIRNGHYWNQVNRDYAPHISPEGPSFAPQLRNYLPASALYDSGEGGAGKPGSTAIYGGHSHVGTLIYQGDNWPAIYRNHLFTHNLHGHQMNHQLNVRRGSGYETMHAGSDLLFAPDPRYIAVDLQTGPDGAVYVIDWYDQQHCHTPADDKWDRSNGRLYRVSWKDTYRPVKVDLHALPDHDLAQMQTHANDWYARTSRLLLQERALSQPLSAEALEVLGGQLKSTHTPHVLRALWTLHATGNLKDDGLMNAAKHPDDRVRAWAVKLATETNAAARANWLSKLAQEDASPAVRLAIASTLPLLDDEKCWAVSSALASHTVDAEDRFLPRMVWFGLARVAPADWTRVFDLAEKSPWPTLADSARWFAGKSDAGRQALVARLASLEEAQARRAVKTLHFSLGREGAISMPAAWPEAQARLAGLEPAAVDELSMIFGDARVLERARVRVADAKTPERERRAAFDLLKRVGDKGSGTLYLKLLDDDIYRSAVIPLLLHGATEVTGQEVVKRYAKWNEADRRAAIHVMSSHPALAPVMLEAVKAGTIPKGDVNALHVRQMRNLKSETVVKLLESTWGRVNDSSAAARGTIAKLEAAFKAAPLWAYSRDEGRVTFQQLCAACHTHGDASPPGYKSGPDLTGTWRNGTAYFLESIVDPNAVVGDQYQLNVITRNDGTVISGMVEQESDATLTIRTVTDAMSVPKADIRQRQKFDQSLMPQGLLEPLPEKKVIELLRYLTTEK